MDAGKQYGHVYACMYLLKMHWGDKRQAHIFKKNNNKKNNFFSTFQYGF